MKTQHQLLIQILSPSYLMMDSVSISGTTSGGNALLIELQGQQFTVPASLTDVALVFKGIGNPQLLPTVAGRSYLIGCQWK